MDSFSSLFTQCFPVSFMSFSYLDSLKQFQPNTQPSHNYITGLKIIPLPDNNVQQQIPELYRLDQASALIVQRNPYGLPIIDIGYFKDIPHGWTKVQIMQQCQLHLDCCLAYLKLKSPQKCQVIDHLQVQLKSEEIKGLQNTQPSISDQQEFNGANTIDLGIFIMAFTKKEYSRSFIQKTYLTLQPKSQILFQRDQNYQNQKLSSTLNKLCFAQGIKVTRKSCGYHFVNLITEGRGQADKYYCSLLVFSQEFSKTDYKILQQNYPIETQNNCLYHERGFLFISEFSCTDQLNKCLEHLYKMHLSKRKQQFQETVKNMDKHFTIDSRSLKVRYQDLHFGLSFKINTSYQTISNHAIYSVFKFLEVPHIITIIQCLLLQKNVFFLSSSNSMIGYFIEAFISFIYPLKWVHITIPFISYEILNYTESPIPIICGVSKNLKSGLENVNNGVFVYLDQNRIQVLPVVQKIPKLKHNLRNQLITRLEKYSVYDPIDVRDYLENPDNLSLFKTREAEDPHFDSLMIRNIMFELLVFMLKDYNQYFICSSGESKETSPARVSIRKLYDFKRLKTMHRKDEFLQQFFDTSLFSVLIEKKIQTPDDKWIKTLDRAIKKIQKYEKHFIQEESDFNETEGEQQGTERPQIIPKGCLNMITMFSKESNEEKTPHSSPQVKRKSLSNERKSEDNQSSMKQRRQSNETNKSDKETSAGNRLSECSIPQLKQTSIKVSHEQQQTGNDNTGVGSYICRFFSYPVIKARDSVAGKWSRKQMDSFKEWVRRENDKKRVKEKGAQGESEDVNKN